MKLQQYWVRYKKNHGRDYGALEAFASEVGVDARTVRRILHDPNPNITMAMAFRFFRATHGQVFRVDDFYTEDAQ